MIAARTQVAFHADSALDLLFQQFRLRGTPDESVWPGIGAVAQSAFSGGVAEWPKWRPKSLRDEYPCLDPDGVSLLDQMLTLDPARRISAADALVHPFFDELDKARLGESPLPEMSRHGPIFSSD